MLYIYIILQIKSQMTVKRYTCAKCYSRRIESNLVKISPKLYLCAKSCAHDNEVKDFLELRKEVNERLTFTKSFLLKKED